MNYYKRIYTKTISNFFLLPFPFFPNTLTLLHVWVQDVGESWGRAQPH